MNTLKAVQQVRSLIEEIEHFLQHEFFMDDEGYIDHDEREHAERQLSDTAIYLLEEIENPTLPSAEALVEVVPRLGWRTREEAKAALNSSSYVLAA